ncbi:DUF7601 domain-containing protein [Clostridium vitabionis]|uniref:DUF7601 domain-containing protein n=1 Tax=Clostridium vitabionis TaxID=2784388 RepID=UPI00188BFCBE|nr:DUF5979 domain-containing protein [Clostridium vitabionis]
MLLTSSNFTTMRLLADTITGSTAEETEVRNTEAKKDDSADEESPDAAEMEQVEELSGSGAAEDVGTEAAEDTGNSGNPMTEAEEYADAAVSLSDFAVSSVNSAGSSAEDNDSEASESDLPRSNAKTAETLENDLLIADASSADAGTESAEETVDTIDPDASGTAWQYSQYYISYEGARATTKNKTQLDLIGNCIESKQTVKYQFQFHNDEDYQAGDVRICLPYYLYNDRDGNGVAPSGVGVPRAPKESKDNDFNYSVETIDGVRTLVFTNVRAIPAGSNNIVQVKYDLDDMATIDGTTWEIKPSITVCGIEGTEDKLGNVLTGSMDTQTQLMQVTKNPYGNATEIYPPELFETYQVQKWIGSGISLPENFDDYRYMVWITAVVSQADQPWTMTIKDTPSNNGIVLAQFLSDYKTESSAKSPVTAGDTIVQSEQRKYNSTFYVYSVTAYPKADFPDDLTIHNTIDVTMTGTDDKIDHVLSSTASWVWEEYQRKPHLGYIHIHKVYNHPGVAKDTAVEPAFLDVLKASMDQGSDQALPYSWTVSIDGDRTDERFDHPDYSYTYALMDDLQYADTNRNQYRLMSYEDYYYKDISFRNTERSLVDIYGDQSETAVDGEEFRIYVMTAAQPGEWQLTDTVAYGDINQYQIPDSWYSEGIYRIKAEHKTQSGIFSFRINATTVLRADSPLFTSYTSDSSVSQIRICNVCAEAALVDGQYRSERGGRWPTSTDVSVDDYDQENYGCLTVRDFDTVTLTQVKENNGVSKTVYSQNNPNEGKVNLTYNLAGWDGYQLYSPSVQTILSDAGIVPDKNRDQVVLYDLLPLGVTFDASESVTVGRLTSDKYKNSAGSWDKKNVSVTYEVTDNYRGSGRQMVRFIITGTESDSSFTEYSYPNGYIWGCGYGVSFSAYYLWKDRDIASAGVNVMAYTVKDRLKGDGTYKDDGTGVPLSVGKDTSGQSYFYDPEDDGISEQATVKYAQASNSGTDVVSAKSGIVKKVRADEDYYAEFASSATVMTGKTYTYELTVQNGIYDTGGLIIYDHLENAIKDRADEETGFDDADWKGTFVGTSVKSAEAAGVSPVVWYSADRDQEMDLSAAGWVKAEDWDQDLSEVRSVAFDLSKKTDGTDYLLDPSGTIKVQVTMKAPETKPDAEYAYNNPAFSSYTLMDGTTKSETKLVVGNSVQVKLAEQAGFAVEKRSVDGDGAPVNARFPFRITVDGEVFSQKEYTLYQNGTPDGKVHSTDTNGLLYLQAGERAVFASVPEGKSYTVEELSGDNWYADGGKLRSGTFANEGTQEEVFANHYKAKIYFEKRIDRQQDFGSADTDEFTFQLLLNGQPAADIEYYLVDRAADYRTSPEKDGEVHTTDSDGNFKLTAQQRALFVVTSGTEYSITEKEYGSAYTCDQPQISGTASRASQLTYITNTYTYKYLTVGKQLTVPDGVTVPDYAYSFILKLNGEPVAGQVYELYTYKEGDGQDASASGTWEKTGTEKTDADGRFTLTLEQRARFIYLPQGAAYEVSEETGSLPEGIVPDGDSTVSGDLPTYSLGKTVVLKNKSTRHSLAITKNLMTTGSDSTTEFRFLVTVNGNLYTGQEYTRYLADGSTETLTTDSQDGTLVLRNGEKAVFQNLSEGDKVTVKEEKNDNYTQVIPKDGASWNGVISGGTDQAEAAFTNGDNKNVLFVSKSVQSSIPGLAEDSKWTYSFGKWSAGGYTYYFRITVNGQPYARQSFQVSSTDGNVKTLKTDSNGVFTLNATQVAMFGNLQDGDSYKVEEVSRWGQNAPVDGWQSGDTLYHHDTGEQYSAPFYWRQILPEDNAETGTMDGTAKAAAFTNELTMAGSLEIRKMINTGWATDASDYFPDYDGLYVLKLRLTLRGADGSLLTGPDTIVQPPEIDEGEFQIDDDGLITISTHYLGDLNDFYLTIPAGYDYKLEEVDASPVSILGKLGAVAVLDWTTYQKPEMDAEGFVLYKNNGSGGGHYQFDFLNINSTYKFKVYKEAEGGNADRTFTYTLYKSDARVYSYDEISGKYDEDADSSYQFVPMPNASYDLYNAAEGTKLGTYETDANGQFTLKAGQYAEFTGYRNYSWSGVSPDGYWNRHPDDDDILYKVVETPYADYDPQVTVVHHSFNNQGKWIGGYEDPDTGNWIPGHEEHADDVTTTVTRGNAGTLMAADTITFKNVYGSTSALVVQKTVRTMPGAAADADEEFSFVLKVNGQPYANQEYTIVGADGAERKDVQTVDGIDVTYPWKTDSLGRFTLKAGEYAKFNWIGTGSTYTVTEEAKDGYTQIEPAQGADRSGVMTEEGAKAEFVNLSDETPKSDGKTLRVSKQIMQADGTNAAPDEEFTFRVSMDGNAYAGREYSVYDQDGTLIRSGELTDGEGKLTIAGNQYAYFKNLPDNSDYQVEEILAQDSSFHPVGKTTIAGSTDEGSAKAVFVNAYGYLAVTKQVVSAVGETAPAEDEFTFVITQGDTPAAGQKYELLNAQGEKQAEGMTGEDGTFTLKAGEYALFTGLTQGEQYQIREEAKKYYRQTVPAKEEGLSVVPGEIPETETFVNRYSRTTNLEITKSVRDAEDNTVFPAQTFTFQILVGGKPFSNRSYVLYGADGKQDGSTMFTDGDGKLQLRAGETAAMQGIVSGAQYLVKECDIPDGYTADQEELSGTASTEAVAAFVNRQKKPTPDHPTMPGDDHPTTPGDDHPATPGDTPHNPDQPTQPNSPDGGHSDGHSGGGGGNPSRSSGGNGGNGSSTVNVPGEKYETPTDSGEETVPGEPEKTGTAPEQGTESGPRVMRRPATGDNSHTVLWGTVSLAALAALLALLIRYKKNKRR